MLAPRMGVRRGGTCEGHPAISRLDADRRGGGAVTESGIAAPHRDRSRPALATGAPDAGRRLARSAAAEAAVAPPVLAAAGTVSTSPGIPARSMR